MAAHCYARRLTQGKFRAVKRPKICPTHGTELPYPRLTEHLRCDGSKEGQGSQEGTSTHLIRARRGKEDSGLRPKPCLVSCPLLPSAVGTASPPPKAAMHTPCHGEYPLPGRAVFASGGSPPYRRKGIPSADGKEKKTSAEGIRKRLPFVKRAFFSCFTSAYAADFRNYSSTFT